MYEMASLYQKAIRRGDAKIAGYAANELWGNYANYLWKRTLVISAEDCYGIITKEILALREADELINKGRKGYEKETVFIGKAMTLLLYAKKNRDACFLACNYLLSDEVLNKDQYYHIEDGEMEKMPEYTFDCHTLRGMRRGKTIEEFIEDEYKALGEVDQGEDKGIKQLGLFDDEPWDLFLNGSNNYKKK